MTGVAVVVIDRLGRRPLLLGGVGGMVLLCFSHRLSFLIRFSELALNLLQEKYYRFTSSSVNIEESMLSQFLEF